jgi:hypothetical protein
LRLAGAYCEVHRSRRDLADQLGRNEARLLEPSRFEDDAREDVLLLVGDHIGNLAELLTIGGVDRGSGREGSPRDRSFVARHGLDTTWVIRAMTLCFVAAAVVACTAEGPRRSEVEATGPPTVQMDDVEGHAAQFDDEVPERRAGTQNEGAASAYLLGHLQQAGYVVRLDSVPVRNLVRSTNVVAVPPSGEDPIVVVVVPYDTGEDPEPSGVALGVFLEAARALRVAVPGHSVEFAALGAEHTDVLGGRLGSRRLIQGLLDDDLDPVVIVLGNIEERAGFSARGPAAAEINEAAESAGIQLPPSPLKTMPDDDVWQRAGLDFAVVSGAPEEAGAVLVEYLEERGR